MILAHGGGWDELLILLVPLAVVALLLWLANRFGSEPADGEGDKADADQ
ncbi:MAG: hypothetical protein M3N68_11345 [Actinomycetota bacterium]|nr:hypothetical protein [Actinomycetota bacterium]